MTKYRRKDGPFRFAYVFVASCQSPDWWYWKLRGQTVLVYLTGWEYSNNTERFGEKAGAYRVGQAYAFTIKKGGALEIHQDFHFDDIIFI